MCKRDPSFRADTVYNRLVGIFKTKTECRSVSTSTEQFPFAVLFFVVYLPLSDMVLFGQLA
jgi:hypothetical protein